MDKVLRSTDTTENRLQRAIGRLRRAIRRLKAPDGQVHVHLEDVRGSTVGLDKRCRVELALPGKPPVSITALSRSWKDSVEAAAGALRRRLLGQRSPQRRSAGRTAARAGRMQTAG